MTNVLVAFKNGYSSRLSVAIMRYDPDACGEYGDWATAGWWNLEPGATASAFWTTKRYAAYYAEAADGSTWSGDRGPVYVYLDAFSSCVKIGSSAASDIVSMRLLDLGSASVLPITHTLELHA